MVRVAALAQLAVEVHDELRVAAIPRAACGGGQLIDHGSVGKTLGNCEAVAEPCVVLFIAPVVVLRVEVRPFALVDL